MVCVLAISYRDDEEASHCAVPISTSLIKQILNKTGNQDNLEHVLVDFYGPKASRETPWPYVTKDTDRYRPAWVYKICLYPTMQAVTAKAVTVQSQS